METLVIGLFADIIVPVLERLLPSLAQEAVDAIEHLITNEQVKRSTPATQP